MFVQWCVKGIRGRLPGEPADFGLTDIEAIDIIRSGDGIQCNWWRNANTPPPAADARNKLTSANLDLHVNNYHAISADTPFISLTAGCVERDVFYRTNRILPAEDTALQFATRNGTADGFLFYCWVIVALKPATPVEGIAEEVRELNSYRSWSDFQLEGELTAKLQVQANQIHRAQWWAPDGTGAVVQKTTATDWQPDYYNPQFSSPSEVSNIRELF